MADIGGQPGNKNAAKSRLIEQALIRAIKQRDLEDGDGETLRKIAEAQIDRALAGDPLSFDRVADRLDGKPAQVIRGPGDAGEHTVITKIEEAIVDPHD